MNMNFWQPPNRSPIKSLSVNSVDALKKIWGINTDPAPREVPPKEVITDIYHTASSARPIPHRHTPRSR